MDCAKYVPFTMCLLSCLATAEADPSRLQWEKNTENDQFSVAIGPRYGSAPIGRFHDWVIRVTDREGNPVYPARIGLAGGMPGHGHGMPSQPQVTEYLGKGTYLAEGMKFNMAGDWVFGIEVETPNMRDRVVFEVTIDY